MLANIFLDKIARASSQNLPSFPRCKIPALFPLRVHAIFSQDPHVS